MKILLGRVLRVYRPIFQKKVSILSPDSLIAYLGHLRYQELIFAEGLQVDFSKILFPNLVIAYLGLPLYQELIFKHEVFMSNITKVTSANLLKCNF